MDKIVYIPGASLGLLMGLVYILRCSRGRTTFDLATLVNVVLFSTGTVAGALLIAGTFVPELRSRLVGLETYTLIGGLAVLAVSVQGLLRDVFQRGRSPTRRKEDQAI